MSVGYEGFGCLIVDGREEREGGGKGGERRKGGREERRGGGMEYGGLAGCGCGARNRCSRLFLRLSFMAPT